MDEGSRKRREDDWFVEHETNLLEKAKMGRERRDADRRARASPSTRARSR